MLQGAVLGGVCKLGLVPLGVQDLWEVGEERNSSTSAAFSPVIGSGNPSPLLVAPNQAGVSRRATRGPSLPHGSSTFGKDGRLQHN